MQFNKKFLPMLAGMALALLAFWAFAAVADREDEGMVTYRVDLKRQQLELYWRDEKGQRFGSLGHLKDWLAGKGKKLVFAMNAGMYRKDGSPQGLFVQAGKQLVELDTSSGTGNFYLKPNGLFYTTTDGKAVVCRTEDFKYSKAIHQATQSGPMLVIDGEVHPVFKKGSTNLNLRNGVGILPNGEILFALSKEEVNLYDFARFFQEAGCKNALYLDGFVSRMYLPEKNWLQLDGDFGAILGVVEN